MKLLKSAVALTLLLPLAPVAAQNLDRPNPNLTPGAVFSVGRAQCL